MPDDNSTDSHPESEADEPISDVEVADLPPAAPFPVEALPPSLRDYVVEQAKSMCCPSDFIAVPMLACAGAAIGTSVQLQLKPDWKEWPLLFTAVVGPSGSKKTPAKTVATSFTVGKGLEYGILHKEALKQYQIDMARYLRAAENGDGPAEEKPRRPTLTRTWLSDSTMEAIAKRLQENPRGLILLRDELASMLLAANQYRGGRGADLQNFLSLWSCDPFTIDRKSEPDPIVLNQPFLAVTGGIQPGLLPKVFGGDRLFDGFTPRFLFAHPAVLPHSRSDFVLNEYTLAAAKATFEALYLITPRDPYAVVPIPRTISLNRGAYIEFARWADHIGGQIDDLAEDDPFRAPLSKMAGQLGRIALVLHCCRLISHGIEHFEELSEETMGHAIMIADYFVAHAHRVWTQLTESREDSQFRRVLAWMRSKKRSVTRREIQRSGVAGFKNTLQVLTLMNRLVQCGLVELQIVGRTERYTLRKVTS